MAADSDSIQVRSAVLDDFAAVRQFMHELEDAEFNTNELEFVYRANLLNQNNIYLVAENNGEVIGFASCHLQLLLHHGGWIGEIQELFVSEQWRARGVGKKLIDRLKDEAIKKGALQLEVTANITRKDTHQFYERVGFVHSHKKFTALLNQPAR